MTLSIRLVLLAAVFVICVPFAEAQPHFNTCASRTAESATVILDVDEVNVSSHTLKAGDEIAIVAGDGRCVGTSAWRDSSFAITVWGMDQFSDGAGMKAGSELRFVVWDASDDLEYQDVTAKYRGGKPYLSTDGIYTKGAVYEVVSLTLKGGGSEAPNPGEAFEFSLEQNYPNPVSSSATIQYALEEDAEVRLEVYNMLGQRILVLVDEQQKAGRHEVHMDARDLPSGAYVYRLRAGEHVDSKRLVVVK